MALIDSYKSSLISKQKELGRLLSDKATVQLKISDLNKKINAANDAIRRTKTASIINSKVREIDRLSKESVNYTKKLADLETKIARKNQEITGYQTKVDKEQAAIDKKRAAENEKNRKAREKNLREINSAINRHDRLHVDTQREINILKTPPKKITVLFLASNPINQPQLRLDEEARAITHMIRNAKHRDSVKLESSWAVQTIDLLQALNEFNPTIVHFSGHGSDQDEIVFQSPDGNAKLVSKEAIVQTMVASSDNIRLVFFNTCFSKNQAEAVSKHIEVTIGMNTSIGDEAARVFSSQFYSSISFGLPVLKAFEQAKAALMLEGINEEDTPELFTKEGFDPNEIILVTP